MAEISVFVLDESKHELTGASALQVTHLQTSEDIDDVKTLFTNETYLQQAERRKISCAIGGRPQKRRKEPENVENQLQTQLNEIKDRLDRQRQMMNILLILSMFQLFIFACTLITARNDHHHRVEL